MQKKLVTVLVLLPIVAISIYLFFASSGQQEPAKDVQETLSMVKDPQPLIEQLKTQLEASPDSAQSWFVLGKLYLGNGQYADAEQALQRAYQLEPDNNDYGVTLAKADFFNHQSHLTKNMEATVKKILMTHPEQIDAINLLAVNAYENQQYHEAVDYWQQALSLVQPDSPDSQEFQDMIAHAQKKYKP